MSAKNKKSVAAQALLEMDSIVSAIKEESKKTLGGLLTEAVKGALRESVEDDEDEKDYEVIDDEKNDAGDKKKKDSDSPEDVDEQGNGEMGDEPQDSQLETDPPQAMPQQAGGQGMGAQQDPSMAAQEAPEAGMEGDGMSSDDAGEGEGEEGWDDFSQYQVGDNTYDLTGENDYNNVVKIYKLLKDDDQVVVKKEGNTIQLQDGQAGTEYVIDLGGEGEEPEAAGGAMSGEEEPTNSLNEDIDDIAGFPGEVGDDEFGLDDFSSDPLDGDEDDDEDWAEGETDFDLGDDFSIGDDEGFSDEGLTDDEFHSDNLEGDENNVFESKKTRKPMKESKEVLFEVDLGYTDNYQDKDPIKGLSNNEPSKSGKSWHKGVPTGTAKPWAGSSKDKGDPFEKTVDEGADCCPKCGKCGAECTCDKEIEEANLSQSRWNDTHAAHNRVPAANDDAHRRKGMQKTSKGTEYRATSSVNESKELKAIKKENHELKKAVVELRKNLNEAYITNVNLGKITKLFLENTTSKAEKVDIVNRFANEANTVEKSKALYESISRELKKTNGKQMNLNETSKTAKGTKELNENTYKSNEVLKTIDLMNRMLNC